MRDNIAARAGRWSAAHWKTATLGWLVLVVAAVALGSLAGTKKLTDAEDANGQSARAERILAHAGFDNSAGEAVLIEARGRARPEAVAADVTAMLRARTDVKNVKAPVRSADGRAELVSFEIRGNGDTADQRVQPVLDAVARVQRANPSFTVAELGSASANRALNATIGKDFSRAEKLSIPLTFLILLLAFGAFVAAGIPVLLAFSAVLAALGLSSLVSHLAHASGPTSSVILLIGMAVGVDYSLFYVKREREERAAGREGRDALHRAAATSGQAVLVSGATVLVAMAGMLFAGSATFTSIGIGAMIVVFVSMVGSLTVLPALLAKLGDRIDRGVVAVLASGLGLAFRRREPRWIARLRTRRTVLQRLKGDRSESRLWAALLRPSLQHPVAAVALSSAVLVGLALPALNLRTKLTGPLDLPHGLAIVQTYRAMQSAFPGAPSPATVVVQAPDVRAPRVQTAIADLRERALATGVMKPPIRTTVNRAHTVETIDVPLVGSAQNAAAVHALDRLRTQVVPATVGRLGGVQSAVTGETAGDVDFTAAMHSHMPIVFAFVLGLAFVLLLLTFRSIVIPLKAIALNLLSVGAAYGVLVWIFQDGHLQGLLGFHSNGGVVTWLPLFLFTILFGLSMDYHVFIVSRIKELVDRGLSTEEAVERGIRSTASTVTSAAFVMVAVFSIFATLSTLDMKQLGVGLAVAVLLDATIIRGVLLPATMKLLGRWNWYLPRGLRWLPQLQAEAA
ncbi:MAG TPA: MMPL family transporter [Gaiellaceae bacterium]|nr:MMPL family transporter [Gaiellaceae bacterium]